MSFTEFHYSYYREGTGSQIQSASTSIMSSNTISPNGPGPVTIGGWKNNRRERFHGEISSMTLLESFPESAFRARGQWQYFPVILPTFKDMAFKAVKLIINEMVDNQSPLLHLGGMKLIRAPAEGARGFDNLVPRLMDIMLGPRLDVATTSKRGSLGIKRKSIKTPLATSVSNQSKVNEAKANEVDHIHDSDINSRGYLHLLVSHMPDGEDTIYKDIYTRLIESGINKDALDVDLRSPLSLLLSSTNKLNDNLIRFGETLIELGCDFRGRDVDDKTPIELAAKNKHSELERALLRKGAKPPSVSPSFLLV
jgi:hypothetical protein